MTGTVVDALQDATAALNTATNQVLALYAQLQQAATAAQTNATTTINNFLSRPLQQTYFVDPSGNLGGLDTNDGLSMAKPQKTIDHVLGLMGAQAVEIVLLGDATISTRKVLPNSLTILGAQPANNVLGYAAVQRKVSFLGTATNSPDSIYGTMSSGILFETASSFSTINIDFDLPAQVSGQSLRAHIYSAAALNVTLQSFALTIDDPSASALFGSFFGGRVIATLAPILGPNAAGHLFDGIAAGGNPNSIWSFASNVTSA